MSEGGANQPLGNHEKIRKTACILATAAMLLLSYPVSVYAKYLADKKLARASELDGHRIGVAANLI